MRWSVQHGEILEVTADVLVCSGNVYLNLSGGVGGALLLKYGDAMQQELHDKLKQQGLRFVPQGTIVATGPHGSPFQHVLHAVAIDVFYESSSEVIESILSHCLILAGELGAKTIAIPALATGYGKLKIPEFANGVRPLLKRQDFPLDNAILCLRNRHDCDELQELLGI